MRARMRFVSIFVAVALLWASAGTGERHGSSRSEDFGGYRPIRELQDGQDWTDGNRFRRTGCDFRRQSGDSQGIAVKLTVSSVAGFGPLVHAG